MARPLSQRQDTVQSTVDLRQAPQSGSLTSAGGLVFEREPLAPARLASQNKATFRMAVHPNAERWNFGVMFGQGTSRNVAIEFSGERLVLPFLYTTLGGSVVYTGLLVPVVILTRLGAMVLGSRLVGISRVTKWYLSLAMIVVASPLIVISALAEMIPVAWLPPAFIAVAALIGAGIGFGTLVFQDMMGRVLGLRYRNQMLYVTGAAAGAVAALVAAGSQLVEGFDPDVPPVLDHVHLVWAGAGLMLLSAFAATLIQEPPKSWSHLQGRAKFKGYGRALRDSLRITIRLHWLRRFMLARILFLSVELGTPFLAAQAAGFYATTVTSLTLFVIASSLGLMIGGLVWPRISRRSVQRVLTLSCLISLAALLFGASSHFFPALESTWSDAIVIVLLAFSLQGNISASALYVINASTDDERPYCLGIANVPAGIAGIGLALALGLVAREIGVVWVLLALAALNLVSAAYAQTLPTIHPDDGSR